LENVYTDSSVNSESLQQRNLAFHPAPRNSNDESKEVAELQQDKALSRFSNSAVTKISSVKNILTEDDPDASPKILAKTQITGHNDTNQIESGTVGHNTLKTSKLLEDTPTIPMLAGPPIRSVNVRKSASTGTGTVQRSSSLRQLRSRNSSGKSANRIAGAESSGSGGGMMTSAGSGMLMPASKVYGSGGSVVKKRSSNGNSSSRGLNGNTSSSRGNGNGNKNHSSLSRTREQQDLGNLPKSPTGGYSVAERKSLSSVFGRPVGGKQNSDNVKKQPSEKTQKLSMLRTPEEMGIHMLALGLESPCIFDLIGTKFW